MPIYALDSVEPLIHPDAYIHPDAVVIGDVRLAAGSSVWPGAVLRGDMGYISVGQRTSIQDGTVLHTTPEWPTVVGNDCVVGHLAHLEGCTVEDECLIGSGSVVLNRAVIRRGSIVGAKALVPEGFELLSGQLAVGVPACPAARPPAAGRLDRDGGARVHRERSAVPQQFAPPRRPAEAGVARGRNPPRRQVAGRESGHFRHETPGELRGRSVHLCGSAAAAEVSSERRAASGERRVGGQGCP